MPLRARDFKSLVSTYFTILAILWSGVEESNLYNDFRRIMSYPLNERQVFGGTSQSRTEHQRIMSPLL